MGIVNSPLSQISRTSAAAGVNDPVKLSTAMCLMLLLKELLYPGQVLSSPIVSLAQPMS